MGPPAGHADLLRELLTDRDVACPNCKYNLRGLQETWCPECGDPLVLALSKSAPKHTAYALSVVPVGMGAIYSVCLTAAEIVYGRADSLHADWRRSLIYAATTSVYATMSLALWHAHRRILRLPLPRTWALCGGAWAAALGVATIASWALRHG
jgi:hypothetical protein